MTEQETIKKNKTVEEILKEKETVWEGFGRPVALFTCDGKMTFGGCDEEYKKNYWKNKNRKKNN